MAVAGAGPALDLRGESGHAAQARREEEQEKEDDRVASEDAQGPGGTRWGRYMAARRARWRELWSRTSQRIYTRCDVKPCWYCWCMRKIDYIRPCTDASESPR